MTIRMEQIGPLYDVAVGYQDPATGKTEMVGYVIAPTTAYQESTDLQDEQHLVQVASPSSTDRFSRYPRVSQGDWTHGEGQLIFIDPQRYYTSIGIDTTKPGNLQLQIEGPSGAQTRTPAPTTGVDTGTYKTMPAASDGINYAYALLDGAGKNIVSSVSGPQAIGNGHEVTEMLAVPGAAGASSGLSGDIFIAIVDDGIWKLDDDGTTTLQLSPDNILPTMQGMAYFDRFLYYIIGAATPGSTNQIWQLSDGASFPASGTPVFTASPWENGVALIASTANGLVFATTALDTTKPPGTAILYTFDGTTATRVADFPNTYIKAAYELNGVTYILAEQPQNNFYSGNLPVPHQPSLFSLVGSSISEIADFRTATADFQVNLGNSTTAVSQMTGDGRYLYIAHPGWRGLLVYDPANNAFFKYVWGQHFADYPLMSHRAFRLRERIASFYEDTQGNQWANVFGAGEGLTGFIDTSYFDFTTPSVVKSFDALEIDLVHPVPPGSSITAQYRTDANTDFTDAQLVTLGGQQLIAVCRKNTKGFRIQWRITLTADTFKRSPQVAAYACKANLGRVWTMTLACRHNQECRNPEEGGVADSQGLTSRELLSNIVNAYLLSGLVTLWIADPTAGQEPYVEQVSAYIEDYQRNLANGVSPAWHRHDDGTYAMEADVLLTLVEQVG